METSGDCKPKGEWDVINTVIQLIKLFPLGVQVNKFKPLYMYAKIEQLSKLTVGGGEQVSHCWSGRFTDKQGEKCTLIRVAGTVSQTLFLMVLKILRSTDYVFCRICIN